MVKLLHYGLAPQLLSYCAKTSHKKKIKEMSNQLRTLASNQKLASISALQIGETTQHFIILSKQYLKQDEWQLSYKPKNAHYRDILNAQINDTSTQKKLIWEQCISYPGIRMLIPRSKLIKLSYMDHELKLHNEELCGFEALVVQHQVQHYYGLDYVKKVEEIYIIDEQLRKKHQDDCNRLVNEYKEAKEKKMGVDRVQESGGGVQKLAQSQINTQYYRLKQFLTYSIVDKMRSR